MNINTKDPAFMPEWMNLENIMLREISLAKEDRPYVETRIVTLIEPSSNKAVTRRWVDGEMGHW